MFIHRVATAVAIVGISAIGQPRAQAISPLDPERPIGHRHPLDVDACRSRDLVGARECAPSGRLTLDGAMPRFVLETGLTVRRLADSLGARHPGFPTRAMRDLATSAALRLLLATRYGWYAGLETGLGVLESGSLNRGTLWDCEGVIGVTASFGPIRLGTEVAMGGRVSTMDNGVTTLVAADAVVEPRVNAEIWLAPWLTGGALAGTSVLEHGSWMTGLYLGFHHALHVGGRG